MGKLIKLIPFLLLALFVSELQSAQCNRRGRKGFGRCPGAYYGSARGNNSRTYKGVCQGGKIHFCDDYREGDFYICNSGIPCGGAGRGSNGNRPPNPPRARDGWCDTRKQPNADQICIGQVARQTVRYSSPKYGGRSGVPRGWRLSGRYCVRDVKGTKNCTKDGVCEAIKPLSDPPGITCDNRTYTVDGKYTAPVGGGKELSIGTPILGGNAVRVSNTQCRRLFMADIPEEECQIEFTLQNPQMIFKVKDCGLDKNSCL